MKKTIQIAIISFCIFFISGCGIKPGDIVENKEYSSKDFSAKNLSDVTFSSSDFTDANFEYANLKNTDFSDSVFVNANFDNADLENAKLHHADFTNASFAGANFKGADLSGMVIENITFEDANFENADLSDASFVNCNFSNSVMKNALITNSNFQESDFSGANMQGAVVDESSFLHSDGIDQDVFNQLASHSNTQFHTEWEIINYFSDVCDSFEGKPDAKPFSVDDSSHDYVVIAASANEEQYSVLPESLATSIWDTDTVICEGNYHKETKTCDYNGGYTLDMTKKEINFTFLEAQTGEIITEETIYAGNNCPYIWEFRKNVFHDTDDSNYIFGEDRFETMIENFFERYTTTDD